MRTPRHRIAGPGKATYMSANNTAGWLSLCPSSEHRRCQTHVCKCQTARPEHQLSRLHVTGARSHATCPWCSVTIPQDTSQWATGAAAPACPAPAPAPSAELAQLSRTGQPPGGTRTLRSAAGSPPTNGCRSALLPLPPDGPQARPAEEVPGPSACPLVPVTRRTGLLPRSTLNFTPGCWCASPLRQAVDLRTAVVRWESR